MSSDRVVVVRTEPPRLPLAEPVGPIEAVFTGADALPEAVASNAEWLWLLDPAVRPDPGALGHLLEGARPSAHPVASVVAGMVRDGLGRPVEDSLPGLEYIDSAAILGLVEQRLLPIRHAQFANCLIRRSCFTRYGLPDTVRFGPYAASAWTAAIVARGEAGYFAPLSVARLVGEPRGVSPSDALAMTYRMLRTSRSGTWTKGESAQILMGLAKQAVGSQRR